MLETDQLPPRVANTRGHTATLSAGHGSKGSADSLASHAEFGRAVKQRGPARGADKGLHNTVHALGAIWALA